MCNRKGTFVYYIVGTHNGEFVRIFRHVPLLAAIVLLQACTVGYKPIITSTAIGRPLSDTAVFSIGHSGLQGSTISEIRAVDGAGASCWQQGCPIWVRVSPGRHTFSVLYHIFNNGIMSHLSGATDVLVPEMKAEHVYIVEFSPASDGKSFRAIPVDLGANPDYGFTIRGQYHRAQF